MQQLERIEKALEYIDDHLDQALPLEQIARVFHFFPYYFHRMFTAVTGRPITAYMRERRLDKACRMLVESRESILDISLECGFDTAQAFCRAFRSRHGLSPTQYKKTPLSLTTLTVGEQMERFQRKLMGGVGMEPRILKNPSCTSRASAGTASKPRRSGSPSWRFRKRIRPGILCPRMDTRCASTARTARTATWA